MALLYKPFNRVRTVLYVVMAGFLFLAPPAGAQTGAYTVAGIQVDVSADNAMNARNQAFEKAQQDAFLKLASQFLTVSELAAFQPPAAAVIAPMIQDYEVTQEKLSSQRYIGTYTFRFKARNARRYFEDAAYQSAGADTPVAASPDDTSSPLPQQSVADNPNRQALLILPFYQIGQQTLLWSAYNGWMQAWRRAGTVGSQVLPLGDLSDVEDIGDDAFNYDRNKIVRALGRYGAKEAVVLIALPDPVLAAAENDMASVEGGSVKVGVYRTDRYDGPQQTGEISVTANPGETRDKVFDRAVFMVQQMLETDWKNSSYVPTPATVSQARSTIDVRVPFADLQGWAAAQRNLIRIQGVEDIILKSLTPREALVGVVYNGDPDTLRIALQQAGMNLSQPSVPAGSAGLYNLYPDQNAPPPVVPVPSPDYGQPYPAPQEHYYNRSF